MRKSNADHDEMMFPSGVERRCVLSWFDPISAASMIRTQQKDGSVVKFNAYLDAGTRRNAPGCRAASRPVTSIFVRKPLS
jgi:hypothetical protein